MRMPTKKASWELPSCNHYAIHSGNLFLHPLVKRKVDRYLSWLAQLLNVMIVTDLWDKPVQNLCCILIFGLDN